SDMVALMATNRLWIRLRPTSAPKGGTAPGALDVPSGFEATVLCEVTRGAASGWPPITIQIEMRGGRPVIRQLPIGPATEPAAAEQVSEATAGRYIMRARGRGHLGRTVRGKKGESVE